MLGAKEKDGTEARKSSKTKQWDREGGSSKEEKRRKKLRGFSVKLVIHHYADPSCYTELQKLKTHFSQFVLCFGNFGAVSTKVWSKLFKESQTQTIKFSKNYKKNCLVDES